MTIEINNVPFTLLHEKALYKEDERLLIIADIHLGKANHFRKHGVAIPEHAQFGDYINLEKLLNKIQPLKVYFLGDLFHSEHNRDWQYFCNLIRKFPQIHFTLVKGNHDIIHHKQYHELCVDVADTITDGPFVYSHEPVPVRKGQVNIVGHIHPGIVLSGLGRQSVKLPCFFITESLVILPAFGVLTGLYGMEWTREARIYGILPDKVEKIG